MTQEDLLSLQPGDLFRIKTTEEIFKEMDVKNVEQLQMIMQRTFSNYNRRVGGYANKILEVKDIDQKRELRGRTVNVVTNTDEENCYIYFDFEIDFVKEECVGTPPIPFDSLL